MVDHTVHRPLLSCFQQGYENIWRCRLEMLLNVANKQSLIGHYGRRETKIPREISDIEILEDNKD